MIYLIYIYITSIILPIFAGVSMKLVTVPPFGVGPEAAERCSEACRGRSDGDDPQMDS